MARVTVWVPDDLHQAAKELPGVNWSAVMQAGLRAAIACDHDELTCSCCGQSFDRAQLVRPVLGRFYTAAIGRLRERVDQAGYEGAARLLRTVAQDHDVPGTDRPLPRPTRAQLDRRQDEAELVELPLEAGARRRHPTAHAPAQEATA